MDETQTKVLNFKHDIRNPLYIAKSLIETHLETITQEEGVPLRTSPKDTKTVLEKSIREIDRALETIRRLHGISRSTAQANSESQTQARRSVHIGEVLRRVTQALRVEHYLEQLMLVNSIPRDLPAIQVNQIDLEEIFYNLIVNAAQAMPEGGTLVIAATRHCEATSQSKAEAISKSRDRHAPLGLAMTTQTSAGPSVGCPRNDSCIQISFQDTGCGISEGALPYIFEPFYTGRSKEGGTGFGLYIVKQLVQRNAGRIAVESRVGGGTTFRLSFPLKTGED